MLAGMICSLASQQRRLLGQKHISFSRDQGAALIRWRELLSPPMRASCQRLFLFLLSAG